MRLVSWNVNGIRAIAQKGLAKSVAALSPDVLCVQETKAHSDQVDGVLKEFSFHYWNSALKKGYAGTAIFSKVKPLAVLYGLDLRVTDEEDREGRVLVAEFASFFLVNVYTPNAQRGLTRLKFRTEWDEEFLRFLKKLDKKKPVVMCGDMNVAHEEIDLARPKDNRKNAGFTDGERAGFSEYVKAGFVDTFRYLHPDEVKYSWWSYMFNARKRNIGWRIDYFLVSKRLLSRVKDAEIRNEFFGSDHCPVSVELEE